MKVLNRNGYLPVDFCPMRGVRAVILCLIAALVLSGCVPTTGTALGPGDTVLVGERWF
jgi:hypothetical protein